MITPEFPIGRRPETLPASLRLRALVTCSCAMVEHRKKRFKNEKDYLQPDLLISPQATIPAPEVEMRWFRWRGPVRKSS